LLTQTEPRISRPELWPCAILICSGCSLSGPKGTSFWVPGSNDPSLGLTLTDFDPCFRPMLCTERPGFGPREKFREFLTHLIYAKGVCLHMACSSTDLVSGTLQESLKFPCCVDATGRRKRDSFPCCRSLPVLKPPTRRSSQRARDEDVVHTLRLRRRPERS